MSLFSIGCSGLNAAQTALNVAGNNIANVNTPGYSRQEVLFSSRTPERGLGVSVDSIRRITDHYLTSQQWRCGSATGFNQSYEQYINTTEQVLGSEAMSITKGVDLFFAALSAAAESPESSASRQQIVSAAQALAGRFNQLAVTFAGQQQQLNEQMAVTVQQINGQSQQVALLNKQIIEVAANGGDTSALEDQRDQAVLALSKELEIQVNRQSDGSLSLSLAQGQPLVLGGSASTLELQGDKLTLQFGPQSFPVDQKMQGSLGGLLAYGQEVLKPTQQELGVMARQLAETMNAQQAAGFDMNTPRTQGKPLFTFDANDPANTLTLSSGFKPEDLAFGASKLDASGNLVADGGIGDNRNLLAMMALKDQHYDAYSKLLGKVAVASSQAKAELAASQQLAKQVSDRVMSVSGVNLDEEGVSIMQYSKAYQANAKVISTADQLFNQLLTMF